MIKFLEMCQRTQNQVQEYFTNQGFTKVDGGCVFVNDDATITLVAHSDTVHAELPLTFKIEKKIQDDYFRLVTGELVKYDGYNDTIISSPEGLGADDRTGCHIIDKIFNSKYKDRFNYLILEDEEIGLVGAKSFVSSTESILLNDTELFIEFDRAGHDFVTYTNGNEEVINFLKSIGVPKGTGSSSDIRELSRHYARPSLNLGVGYSKQHTFAETQSMKGIDNAIYIAIQLLNEFDGTSLEIDEYVAPAYSAYNSYGYYHGAKWNKKTQKYE